MSVQSNSTFITTNITMDYTLCILLTHHPQIEYYKLLEDVIDYRGAELDYKPIKLITLQSELYLYNYPHLSSAFWL